MVPATDLTRIPAQTQMVPATDLTRIPAQKMSGEVAQSTSPDHSPCPKPSNATPPGLTPRGSTPEPSGTWVFDLTGVSPPTGVGVDSATPPRPWPSPSTPQLLAAMAELAWHGLANAPLESLDPRFLQPVYFRPSAAEEAHASRGQ
jgi:hypothetical protein